MPVQTAALVRRKLSSSTLNIILSTVGICLLSLALPVMTLQVYDRILPNPDTGTLPVLVFGVLLALVLELVLRISRSWVLSWSGARNEYAELQRMMDHFLRRDLSSARDFKLGEHLEIFASPARVRDFGNGYSLMIKVEMLLIPVYIVLIAYIAGPLAAVPAVLLMVFSLIFLREGRRLKDAIAARETSDARRHDFLIECLEGVHTVKAFALENIFLRQYEKKLEPSVQANLDVVRAGARCNSIASVFSQLILITVIGFGAGMVLHAKITTGALVATILLSGRMMQPVQKALALWMRYQDGQLAFRKIDSFYEQPAVSVVQTGHAQTIRTDISPDEVLVLDNVSLGRRGQDGRLAAEEERVIPPSSCRIRRGDCVLVEAAPSLRRGGSARVVTSLMDMISGLYAPDSGSIYVNGIHVGAFEAGELIKSVGYISPQMVIFRGTIRDNLTCFGTIPEKSMRMVAALLDVDRDVAALPAGYDTFLTGNSSDSISPSLRQRICIVRALAHKPQLILLENVERGLDSAGYKQIYSLIARLQGRVTMLLATQDSNLRALCNRRLVIDAKGIAEVPLDDAAALPRETGVA